MKTQMALNYIDSLVETYIKNYNEILKERLKLRRRFMFEFNESVKPLIKIRIATELDKYRINHRAPTNEELLQFGFGDYKRCYLFDEIVDHMVEVIPYEDLEQEYWDSIQEEDFKWITYLSERGLECDFWVLEQSKISKLEKVMLISEEMKGNPDLPGATFHFVVQDALTKKYFVFATESSLHSVKLLTPEGLTEQEYLLYQLQH